VCQNTQYLDGTYSYRWALTVNICISYLCFSALGSECGALIVRGFTLFLQAVADLT
jgi:hypothetical protein